MTNGALSLSDYNAQTVAFKNSIPGVLVGDDCELCLNRGVIYYERDNCVVARECKCMASRRSMAALRQSGLDAVADIFTLERYRPDAPWQQDAKNTALRYLSDFRGKWFCALGTVGSGKTHLCTAVSLELIKTGRTLRYFLWRDEAVKLKALVNDYEEYSAILEPFKRADVLYIDDLFKTERGKAPTTGDINLAFELLNNRYMDPNKITIISSELLTAQLLEVDEAIGSRIYQRSKDYCLEFTGKGKNQRLRGAADGD